MRTVMLLAYEGFQLLDLTGPASVFAEAAAFLPAPPYRILIGSTGGGLVASSSGVALSSTRLADAAAAETDTLIIPGGRPEGLRALLRDPAAKSWTLAAHGHGRRVASVCTGAFALASWGLLEGRRAATHWQAAGELARRFPGVTVDAEALFLEDKAVWTSAGVSTGIDMALAFIDADLGGDIAARVAQRLVLQMRRPGHQSQFSTVLRAQGGSYATLIDWMSDNLTATLDLAVLAGRAGQSPRTFHRRFTAETGKTPASFVEELRLGHARILLEAKHHPKRVSAMTGYRSLDQFGRAFRRRYGLSPSDYRVLHG